MSKLDDIYRYLTTEAGYAPAEAEIAAEDLAACGPDIQAAFELWRQTGRLAPLQVAEFTLANLVSDYRFHPVAALLTMDWLLSEPDAAVAALRHGYDLVETGKT